jgi:hypothetical protein
LLTGGRETFGGDGGGHHSHCAQVHDTDDKEDHRQAGTAVGYWVERTSRLLTTP